MTTSSASDDVDAACALLKDALERLGEERAKARRAEIAKRVAAREAADRQINAEMKAHRDRDFYVTFGPDREFLGVKSISGAILVDIFAFKSRKASILLTSTEVELLRDSLTEILATED